MDRLILRMVFSFEGVTGTTGVYEALETRGIGKNAILDIILAMRIHVLALDGAFYLGLSVVLDAFKPTNELIEVSDMAVPRFDVRIVGVRRKVTTSQGLAVPVQSAGTRGPDCVVVPATGFKMPGPLETPLARPDIAAA